jgi:hypothetical protein
MILDLVGQLPGYVTMNFVPGTGAGPVAFTLFQDAAHAQEALNALQGRTICETPVIAQVTAAPPCPRPHQNHSHTHAPPPPHLRHRSRGYHITHPRAHAPTRPRMSVSTECLLAAAAHRLQGGPWRGSRRTAAAAAAAVAVAAAAAVAAREGSTSRGPRRRRPTPQTAPWTHPGACRVLTAMAGPEDEWGLEGERGAGGEWRGFLPGSPAWLLRWEWARAASAASPCRRDLLRRASRTCRRMENERYA